MQQLTQKIKEECDCCNEVDTTSKECLTKGSVRLFLGQLTHLKTP